MDYAKRALAAASSLLMGGSAFAAPLVLEGNYVKIGVNDAGTIGSGGNTSPGILYDSTGTATFNPSYDYLTPGTPFEGWRVKGIDGTSTLFNYYNNNTNVGGAQVTGTLVDKSGISYRGVTFDNRAVWSGSKPEFDIEHDYRFNDNQQFVDINTRLDFKIAVPTFYFGRFTDPDARAAAGDSSATLNTRGYAGGVPATNVVLSEALVSKYALGLFTAASNSNTGISAAWSTDPIDYYNGTNGGPQGDHTIGLAFMFSGINAGDIVDIQYAYIFGPSAFAAADGAVTGGAGGATPTSFTVTDVGSASAPTPSAPTVTGTTTTNTVATSTAETSRTETSYTTRTLTDTDSDGNPRVRTYTDTITTTIPVITTTTTTTPVTTTTYSDGTSTSTNGTPVVTTASANGTPTSAVTATVLDSTAITAPVTTVTSSTANTTATRTVTRTIESLDADGNPISRTYTDNVLDITPVTTYVTTVTPTTTTTLADGTTTVTPGTGTSSSNSVNGTTVSAVTGTTLASTSITKTVTTSSDSLSSRTETRTVSRTVTDTDAAGNPRTKVYTDTIADTTPITTTTTLSTPITTVYNADDTTSVINGTTTTTTATTNGATISSVISSSLDSVTVTKTEVETAEQVSEVSETKTATRTVNDVDESGNARTRTYTDTIVEKTPVTTTVTKSVPVTTTTYADGSVNVVRGEVTTTSTPVVGEKTSSVIATSLDSATVTRTVTTASNTPSSKTATRTVTRTVNDTDAAGNPRVRTYTDTILDTTPVTTTTTSSTPVTTTYNLDGSTTVVPGETVATSTSTDGETTSAVLATSLDSTAVTRQSVTSSSAPSTTLPTVKVKLTQHKASETKEVQKIGRHHTTTTTTPMVKTIVNTPVTTTSFSDGTETVANGTPLITSELWNSIAVSHDYDALFGRVDQLLVLDAIGDGINSLLNHESSGQTKNRLRVFENNKFVQSYNANGYTADSKVFGGGFEFDVNKKLTVGGQYNYVNTKLDGVDSKATQNKNHFGLFSTLNGTVYGKSVTLNTNFGLANSDYSYTRNVENVFKNAGETKGVEWWASNRLYVNLTKWLQPFVGYTFKNLKRDAYKETGSIQSARTVEALDKTTHVGEAGVKLSTRFGGKKQDLYGVSVDGVYGTDSSYGVTASVDYKEMVVIEASHGVNDGVTNNSIAGKVRFKF